MNEQLIRIRHLQLFPTLQKVSATDGAHVATARVVITVLDENDNAPVCTSMHYSKSIPENTSIGVPILQVRATDDDYGLNSHLKFTLYGVGAGKFSLNPDNGYLSTRDELDRESQVLVISLTKSLVLPIFCLCPVVNSCP